MYITEAKSILIAINTRISRRPMLNVSTHNTEAKPAVEQLIIKLRIG